MFVQCNFCTEIYATVYRYSNVYAETTGNLMEIGGNIERYYRTNGHLPEPNDSVTFGLEKLSIGNEPVVLSDVFQSDHLILYFFYYMDYIMAILWLLIPIYVFSIFIILTPVFKLSRKNKIYISLPFLIFIIIIHSYNQTSYIRMTDYFRIGYQMRNVDEKWKMITEYKSNPIYHASYIKRYNDNIYGNYLYALTLDQNALVLSQAMDDKFEYNQDQISKLNSQDIIANITTYSPTNGLQSSGDLWILLKNEHDEKRSTFQYIKGL